MLILRELNLDCVPFWIFSGFCSFVDLIGQDRANSLFWDITTNIESTMF